MRKRNVLVAAGRLVETEMTELPEAENSTGWLQRPERSDDRRLTAGMMEREVGVMTTNEVGNGKQISDTNQLIQVWRSKTMQHTKRHESHLEVDPFWQAQPMQDCKGVRDMIITTGWYL